MLEKSTENGVAKYYHDRTHPIDIHAVAQSIITLVELRDLRDDNFSLAQNVFQWAFDDMRDPTGCYYFQKCRLITNRNLYMRWSQAWMLLAVAILAEGSQFKVEHRLCDPRIITERI
jgi:hypothetical protein